MANIPSLESLITNLDAAVSAGIISPTKSQLFLTLKQIESSLKNIYNTDGSIITPELQGASYDQMLGELRNNFSSLSSSLSTMRSSFLPVELVDEIIRNDGQNIKIEEIIQADADKESFENVFFRLIGMPFSDELEDEVIKSVSRNGQIIDLDKTGISARLTERQTPVADRTGYPNLNSFIFNQKPPLEYFESNFADNGTILTDINSVGELLKTFNNLLSNSIMPNDLQKVSEIKDKVYSILKKYDSQNISTGEGDSENITENTLLKINDTFDQIISLLSSASNAQETNTILVDSSIRAIFEDSIAIILAPNDYPDIISKLYDQIVLGIDVNISIDNLSDPNNFWKYSYLLFPPVQDGRISKCINDTSRLTAQPFMPESQRVVNKNNLRSTLLEAIIRIRLDINAGTTFGISTSPINLGDDKNIKYRDISDTYGLLETLFIGRLFAALEGMALNLLKNTELLKIQQSKSTQKPDPNSLPPRENAQPQTTSSGNKSEERKKLEQQIAFEESILLLLGQNSQPEALRFQEGSGFLRTSNIKDAHLMSMATELVSIPLTWADEKIKKIIYDEDKLNDSSQPEAFQHVSKTMGISKGVGALDALVFITALFAAQEITLLSLLNEEQFNNLKKQFPSKYFRDIDGKEIKRKTKAKAVEEISLLAIDTYSFFQFLLSQPRNLGFGTQDNLPADAETE